MELIPEQIKEIGLSEEQLPKLKTIITDHVATLKQEWDGKANKDAEAIIQGAINITRTQFGLTGEAFDRKEGEKIADHLKRITPLVVDNALIKEKTALQQKEKELTEKIANGSADESLKVKLKETEDKLDVLKQKEANYADWEENDYKGKLEIANKTLSNQTKDIAFSSVRPFFPESVNKYEAQGRWKEFKDSVNNKYHNFKKVENDWVVVDKENEHITKKLSDLVKQDKALTELLQGRKFTGLGSETKKEINIEGVPFKVPENATSKERQDLITDYMINVEKISFTSDKWAPRYNELNTKILERKPA